MRGGTEGFAAFDSYLWRIARFTLLQALLSTPLSVGLAIPLARALHAHPAFPGRAMILRLFALPLALPALVAVLGITSIYGRNGLLAALFSWLGLDAIPNIYGLTGILIAHVFSNLPLATRLLLSSLDSIPEDYWKLSSQLGMGDWARFRLIEWPVILRNLSGIAGLDLHALHNVLHHCLDARRRTARDDARGCDLSVAALRFRYCPRGIAHAYCNSA